MLAIVAFLGPIGLQELIIILAVLLIFFGAKRLPELAKGLGQGIKEFKKATREIGKDDTPQIDQQNKTETKDDK
ncbi:twin-arginine translocase TatA/TatE family subunit [candidate division KSB1 bacterium]|nr:twin-arginine translocase TatA/TatE family subunit [candidate division KSB1 bacterium]